MVRIVSARIDTGPIFARFDHDDQMSVVRIEIVIVFEKVKLRIAGLLRFQHDFHLNARLGDEPSSFLDHRVQFNTLGLHRWNSIGWMTQNGDTRMNSLFPCHKVSVIFPMDKMVRTHHRPVAAEVLE